MSKDGEVIVFHDETVDRVTDGHGKIEDMTLAEIKALNVQGEKIATLQEVIDLCKGKIDLQIELKGKGTPQPVNDLIIKNGIENEVLITSFNIKLLKEMRKINPRIKMGLLFGNIPVLLWDMISRNHLNYICPKADIVTEDMIVYAHDMGVKVYAYHTNDQFVGRRLMWWQIDDIGTDFPEYFLPFPLNEQKMERYERKTGGTFRTF